MSKRPYLRQNRSGVYEIAWSERSGDRYVTKSLSTRTADGAEAETVLQSFISGQQRIDELLAAPTVNELIRRYQSALEAKKAGETQHTCLMHLETHLGKLRLPEISDRRLLAYRKARNVSDGTLRRELGALRAVFSYAVKHKLIKHDDAPHIELPRASEPRTTYLSPDEEADFYARAMAHSSDRLSRLSRWVAIALNTGQRKTAILNLKWSQVNLETGFIDFRQAGAQQTKKRKGVTPINKRLREVLERAYAEREGDYVLDHTGSIRSQWETWIATTPYQHVIMHDLRRTFCTILVMKGVPITTVAGLINDNPATMLKHYAHFAPSSGVEAIELMGQ